VINEEDRTSSLSEVHPNPPGGRPTQELCSHFPERTSTPATCQCGAGCVGTGLRSGPVDRGANVGCDGAMASAAGRPATRRSRQSFGPHQALTHRLFRRRGIRSNGDLSTTAPMFGHALAIPTRHAWAPANRVADGFTIQVSHPRRLEASVLGSKRTPAQRRK